MSVDDHGGEDWNQIAIEGRRTRIVSPDPTALRQTVAHDNSFTALDDSSADADSTEGIENTTNSSCHCRH